MTPVLYSNTMPNILNNLSDVFPSRHAGATPEMDNESDDGKLVNHAVPFPWKLHEMLDAADKEGFSATVSWLPDERSFKVFQTEIFVRDIMPKWFRQTKYKSFQRQCKCKSHFLKESERKMQFHPYISRLTAFSS